MRKGTKYFESWIEWAATFMANGLVLLLDTKKHEQGPYGIWAAVSIFLYVDAVQSMIRQKQPYVMMLRQVPSYLGTRIKEMELAVRKHYSMSI